ncbi:MAG: DUF1559 domain-containing protein [Planctomycetota bacterium]|nr:MAG: DUF1559 domain-containing protein [Planctomycetota bacterium]
MADVRVRAGGNVMSRSAVPAPLRRRGRLRFEVGNGGLRWTLGRDAKIMSRSRVVAKRLASAGTGAADPPARVGAQGMTQTPSESGTNVPVGPGERAPVVAREGDPSLAEAFGERPADEPFQFGLGTLLFGTTLCAVAFAFVRFVGFQTLGLMLFGLVVILTIVGLFVVVQVAAFSLMYGTLRATNFLVGRLAVFLNYLTRVVDAHRRRTAFIFAIVTLVGGLLMATLPRPFYQYGVLSTPKEMVVRSNLQELAKSLYRYEEDHGHLPPAYLADADGKPMHSWRVLLLPYLGADKLYEAYDFSEPWDGPNNRQLHGDMPYYNPSPYGGDSSTTSYLAVVGPGTMWPEQRATALEDVPSNDRRNTLLLVAVKNSDVHWMEPRDLSFETLVSNAKRGEHAFTSTTGPTIEWLDDEAIELVYVATADAGIVEVPVAELGRLVALAMAPEGVTPIEVADISDGRAAKRGKASTD